MLTSALVLTSTCKEFDRHRSSADRHNGGGGTGGHAEAGFAGADEPRGIAGTGAASLGGGGDAGHGAPRGGAGEAGNSRPPEGGSANHAGNTGLAGEGGNLGAAGDSDSGGEAGLADGKGASANAGVTGESAGGASSHAGTSAAAGEGGSFGEAGEAGRGRPGPGGEAGSRGDGQLDDICRDDETVIPECVSNPGGQFPIMITPAANGVGVMATEAHGGSFHAFASKSGTHMIALAWGNQDLSFTPWVCFDAVPYPRRVAATTLRTGTSEVFVTTDCGQLYVRRLIARDSLYAWSNWVAFGLPSPKSFVTDVGLAVSSEQTNQVYIVDRGAVFRRYRLGAEPYGPFSPWEDIGFSHARIVTAGLRMDNRQQVFVLDEAGRPSSAVQVSSDLESGFQAPSDFDASAVPMLLDIEAAYGTAPLDVLAVDVDGTLWMRREGNEGIFSSWTAWPGPPPPEELVALAAAGLHRLEGAPLLLFAVGRSGTTYRAKRANDAWQSWQIHQ